MAAAYASASVTTPTSLRQPQPRLQCRVARRTRWQWGCRTASRGCSHLAGTAGDSAVWAAAMSSWSASCSSWLLARPWPLAVATVEADSPRRSHCTLLTDREERQKFTRALKPTPVARLGSETIVSVAAGGGALTGHSAAASANGKLFTWGRATEGQLGHGPAGNNTVVAAPRLVVFSEPVRVAMVAAAGDHTAVLSTHGVLYTFGTDANKTGKLCHGELFVCEIPRKVAPGAGKFASVSCGLETTAVVTDTGDVLMCGQLPTAGSGVGRAFEWHNAATLEAVELPARVAQVSCGSKHFAALGTAGEVYTWGAGNYGKLGLGGRDDTATPSIVRGELEGKTVHAVSCGDHHTGAISSEGQLFTWGRGAQGRLVRHTRTCRLSHHCCIEQWSFSATRPQPLLLLVTHVSVVHEMHVVYLCACINLTLFGFVGTRR